MRIIEQMEAAEMADAMKAAVNGEGYQIPYGVILPSQVEQAESLWPSKRVYSMSIIEQIKALVPEGAYVLTPLPHLHAWKDREVAVDGKTLRALAESHERLLALVKDLDAKAEANVYCDSWQKHDLSSVDFKTAIEEAEKI